MSCFYSLHFLVLASGLLLLCLRVDPSESSAKSQFYDLADFPLPVIPMRDPYYASYYASNNNNWHNDGGPAQFKIDTHNNNNRQELESSFLAAERQGSFGGGNKGFGTLTLTLGSSYSTFTVTTSTTCTTSTAAIKVCSPSKGRRRRSNFGIHRLMFDEEEFDESAIFAPRKTEDDHQHLQSVSSIFLWFKSLFYAYTCGWIWLSRKRESSAVTEIESTPEPIPFIVQPGFISPGGVGQGRFFIAFASSTLTTTTTSTYVYILTATCMSTTTYQTCGTGYANVVGSSG